MIDPRALKLLKEFSSCLDAVIDDIDDYIKEGKMDMQNTLTVENAITLINGLIEDINHDLPIMIDSVKGVMPSNNESTVTV
jgi:hypothetical protein